MSDPIRMSSSLNLYLKDNGRINKSPVKENDGINAAVVDNISIGSSPEQAGMKPSSFQVQVTEPVTEGISPSVAFDSVLENNRYADPLDIATSLVPGSPTGVLNAAEPDRSFSQMVSDAPGDFRYRQDQAGKADPGGDAHLIRDLDQVPADLMKQLFNFAVRKKKPTGAVKADITIGKQKPIKLDALMNKFKQIIKSNPKITPKIGKEHEWSPQAKKYLRFGFVRRLFGFLGRKNSFPVPLFGRSKLFLCLACGWTSRYMKTGNETQLESKLMKYKDRSVKIDDVLRESYVLNDGDLYGTLMTAENVLGGKIFSKNRANAPLQKKLEYIRNDSSPEGDNYGAWYHFAGAALFGLMRSPVTAKAVVKIESMGSLLLEGKDPQEDHINNLGAEFGSRLRKMMKDESWKEPMSIYADTDYMNLGEFNIH